MNFVFALVRCSLAPTLLSHTYPPFMHLGISYKNTEGNYLHNHAVYVAWWFEEAMVGSLLPLVYISYTDSTINF